jgi:hypothetical protein
MADNLGGPENLWSLRLLYALSVHFDENFTSIVLNLRGSYGGEKLSEDHVGCAGVFRYYQCLHGSELECAMIGVPDTEDRARFLLSGYMAFRTLRWSG